MKNEDPWRKISWYFKPTMWASLVAAILAHVVVNFLDGIFLEYSAGEVRGYIFLGIMYFTWVPYLVFKMYKILRQHDWCPPKRPIGQRIVATIFCFLMGSVLTLLPIAILEFGKNALGRAGLMFGLITEGFIGMTIFGGILAYGSALGAWIVIFGTFSLWKK